MKDSVSRICRYCKTPLAEAHDPAAMLGAVPAAWEADEELARARAKHAAMHSAHEGYAVILEELDELWEEVRAQKQDKAAMRKEALQVAAMALRFVEDICDAREKEPHHA